MSRFMVVEDEMMVAMLLEDMLDDLGHTVVCCVQRLDAAKKAAETAVIDAAILDVNLAGATSFPVAEILTERKIPFLFASGYGKMGLEDPFKQATIIAKPFTRRQLEAVIDKLE